MTVKPKTEKRKNDQNRNTLTLGGIIAAAVVVAVLAIFLSSNDTSLAGGGIDYSEIPQERTADGAFVLGNPDAPVTVVAFEDFLCPACQQYQSDIKQFMRDEVVTGNARFEFRMLPISGTSSISFGLAECAEELRPGSFWEAHDIIFDIASSENFDSGSARTFAQRMDMSYNELLNCQGDADQYLTDAALADQVGANSTPTVFFRLADGNLTPSPIGQRPNAAQLSSFIATLQ